MESLFRTRAWVQSWVDIWRAHPKIKLIDIGGRNDPLEMLYVIEHKLKGVVPVKSIVSAGYGFADFDPPRAEYNNLDSLIKLTGGFIPLVKELKKFSWNQLVLPDLCGDDLEDRSPEAFSCNLFRLRSDLAYRIKPGNFEQYKCHLSAATRAKYFNRRNKLSALGTVELLELENSRDFFWSLNEFHQLRWGRPCYSGQSMEFFSLFVERIKQEGGRPIMQRLQVNGEAVSVLFDIVWHGTRYNLQSGYAEGRYGNLALGSLHLGFAIEQALAAGQAYDFLAGTGKHANYKEKISTETVEMNTYCLARGWLRCLYNLYGR